MAVSKDKTRITISIGTATAKRWRTLAAHFGMPASVLSNSLEEVISGLCELMEQAQREGQMDIATLQKFTGAQMRKAEQIDELTLGGTRTKGETFDEAKRRQERNPDSE